VYEQRRALKEVRLKFPSHQKAGHT
jgi:hypothetical protein